MAIQVKNVKLNVEPESWYGPLPQTDEEAVADLEALYWRLSSWRFRSIELIDSRITLSAYDDDRERAESLFWALEVSGHTVEMLDGSIVVHPRPTIRHEELRAWLGEQFDSLCRARGWTQRTDARLAFRPDDHNDHSDHSHNHDHHHHDEWLTVTAPDLVVTTPTEPAGREVPAHHVLLAAEVLAPSSQHADRELKPAACARAGIPLYLLADPIALTLFSGPAPHGYGTSVTIQGRHRQLYLPAPFDYTIHLGSRPMPDDG